jgi:GT2 family glycosyltransferase
MHIFVVDNGAEIPIQSMEFLHIFHNRNTGGSGGFQRGLEEIRKFSVDFSHVIFMDDDVEFEIDAFYILFDFLKQVDDRYVDHPVAGRMFCMDKPMIQYTAPEIWNGGNLEHVGFMQDMSDDKTPNGTVVYDCGADYGGWWFCCYPMSFAKNNDVIPFFIHCDDVEYGLRCGKKPIIITGVRVWHGTFEKRQTPLMLYYDTRNPLFVNELYHLGCQPEMILTEWKKKITEYHVKQDWLTEYYLILALRDYLRGMKWLKRIDSQKYHRKLQRTKSCRLKNALAWRVVERQFQRRFHSFSFFRR